MRSLDFAAAVPQDVLMGEKYRASSRPWGITLGLATPARLTSSRHPLQMSPESGKSFNCFFHMPFAGGARIEVGVS